MTKEQFSKQYPQAVNDSNFLLETKGCFGKVAIPCVNWRDNGINFIENTSLQPHDVNRVLQTNLKQFIKTL